MDFNIVISSWSSLAFTVLKSIKTSEFDVRENTAGVENLKDLEKFSASLADLKLKHSALDSNLDWGTDPPPRYASDCLMVRLENSFKLVLIFSALDPISLMLKASIL